MSHVAFHRHRANAPYAAAVSVANIDGKKIRGSVFFAAYRNAGSTRSGCSPSSVTASAARPASNLPSLASLDKAALAIASAPFSKNFRNDSRLSLRPNPSVPRVTSRPGNHGAIWSGTIFM
jgi:hypothetical protein